VTSGWRTVKLGEVADFVRGISFKPDDVVPLGTPGSIACMRTANVQAELDLGDVWAVPRAFCRRDEQQLQVGDLLVSTANSWNLVGKCAWIDELPWPSTFGGFISVLRALSPDLDPRFLYRWFSSPRVQATLRSYGNQTTNISNLSLNRCRAMPVPLPPIEEQRRIAAVLDQADELRAKRRSSLELLDTLTESIFVDTFGDPASNPMRWPLVPLGEEAIDIRYGTGSPPPYVESGVPFIRATNIKHGTIVPHDMRYIDSREAAALVKCRVRSGHLLIVRSGVNTGECAIVPDEYDQACAAFDLIVELPRSSAVFYNVLLNSSYGRRVIAPLTRRAAQQHLNAGQLRSLKLIAPPQEGRDEFAAKVASMKALRIPELRSADELDALFSSLRHRAFAGQL
jgi:type I restriction enzyme S subunit